MSPFKIRWTIAGDSIRRRMVLATSHNPRAKFHFCDIENAVHPTYTLVFSDFFVFLGLHELSRYAAKTFSVSNVLCESVRKPQTRLKVRTDCNLPTAMEIKENLRVRVLTMTGFMI